MTTMYDVDAQELIKKAAEELKKVQELKAPAWAPFVKTGNHKERPPMDSLWWYARAASVLRTVYRLGPVGVSKLRTKYGGRKNRGVKKDRFSKGSGSILRKALQQLEKAGYIKFTEKGVHKGRVITSKGKSFLDKIAAKIIGAQPAKQLETPETAKNKSNIVAVSEHAQMSEMKISEHTRKSKIFDEPMVLDKAPTHEVAEIKQEKKAVKKAEEASEEASEQNQEIKEVKRAE